MNYTGMPLYDRFINWCSFYGLKYSYEHFLILQKFVNIFCSRYQYKTTNEDLKRICLNNNSLEMMLFFSQSVAWFKDEKYGLQCLPAVGSFEYHINGYPKKWRIQGYNGYTKELDESNSVLMFNDHAWSIPLVQTLYDINFMVECDKTHRQELKAQRRPLIMEIEEDEKKSAKKFITKLIDFDDVIAVRVRDKDSKNVKQNPYNTQVFNAGESNFTGKEYMDDYKEFENRILTYYGINNVSIEKRERLLTGEISANDMLIQINYTDSLSARKEALEKVKDMFGESITVEPTELFALQAQNLNTQQQFIQGGNNERITNTVSDKGQI